VLECRADERSDTPQFSVLFYMLVVVRYGELRCGGLWFVLTCGKELFI
jgi:hypothetical protein